jgi:ABC-type proline/glycine betaine transport system ATPase subunit
MSALAVGGSAVNGFGMGELSIAAAVLLTPHYMTKAVMNPKLGDRILKIATGKFDKFKDMADIVNVAASNFVQGLTVEEQEQVVQYLQAMANQNERAELVEKTKNERIQ